MQAETLLERYSSWRDFDVLENANKYPGPTGFLAYVAEKAIEEWAWRKIPADARKLHMTGLIYIHKMPYAAMIPYCCGHSIARLLKRGLITPSVAARPARHFDTFVDHVANYLITMQHYFSGAQALGAVELYAGAFIRRDGLDYRGVKQQVQRLVYNLNFPSRAGMQSPFTNLTVVLDAASKKLEEDAIVGGEAVGSLGGYLGEARLFVKALAEVLGCDGPVFTFPIVTYMVTAKSLWEDPELYEAVFKAAARRGIGYWLNTRVVDPDAAFSMCCRLTIRLSELSLSARRGFRITKADIDEAREEWLRRVERGAFGGIWSIPDATGSKAVVTINIPRLVLEARGGDGKFWELLDEVLGVAANTLLYLANLYDKLAREHSHMYSMPLMYVPEAYRFKPTTFFLTFGVIGLPEAAAIALRNPRLWFDGSRREWMEAVDWMRDVVEYIVAYARKMMVKTGHPFNVEEVPGESAAAKLAEKDMRRFPELAEYLPDAEYPIYSTSIAPYYGALELPDRVEIESRVQKLFTGGVMMHIFLGEEPDPEALAKLTKKLMQTDLVYWSYTPAVTECKRCGHIATGLRKTCPKCGSDNVEVWSRIVGYYRPLKNWNPHRKHEFWYRRHYSL